MPGYSGTPLVGKLGIREGMRVVVRGGKRGEVEGLLQGVKFGVRGVGDVTLVFAGEAGKLGVLKEIRETMPQAGAVWVCWPKKASGVRTDLTDGVVRAAGLGAGLVDVKVCAVSEVWSGLKFVIRVKDRRRE